MKTDFRVTLSAVIALILLGFGIFWGVAVLPKKNAFWSKVSSVTEVQDARIEMDAELIRLNQSDAEKIFHKLQSAPSYLANHAVTKREGWITFGTNEGDIRFFLIETSNQGVLLKVSSNGEDGWHYGTKRCDEIGPFLPSIKDKAEKAPR